MMAMLRRLLADRSGNVLMITGLAFLLLIAIAGAGIDFGRQQLMRIRLQQATDAAALAAANLPASVADSAQTRTDMALRYYRLNMPASYLGQSRPEPQITVGNTITVRADRVLNTDFIRTQNVHTLDATGRTTVQRAQNGLTNYDVALVMDNSGSMGYEDVGSVAVRLPPSASAVTAGGHASCLEYYGLMARQDACTGMVAAGYYSNRFQCISDFPAATCAAQEADTTASAGVRSYGASGNTRLNALRFAADHLVQILLDSNRQNRVSTISWAGTFLGLTPLTNNRGQLQNFIDSMFAFEATDSTQGLARAEQLMADARADLANRDRAQAVILLSDGINSTTNPRQFAFDGTSFIIADGSSPPCDSLNYCPSANSQSLGICERLRAQNVQIYTIAFGQDIDGNPGSGAPAPIPVEDERSAQQFLRDCASPRVDGTPHFYYAPDAETLDRIIVDIIRQIQSLKIVN